MRIIDCFTFFNELKMLEFRLAEMYDFVDYFVLVESTKTFTNKDKDLYYQNNKHLFEKYRDKIIHVIVDDADVPVVSDPDDPEIIGNQSNDENWTRERFQRNCIMRGLNKINPNMDDIILINDVDEVVSSNMLQYLRHFGVNGMYVLAMDAYLYNFTNKIVYKDHLPRICSGSRAIDYESLLNMGTPDKVRNTFFYNKPFYPNGGPNDGLYAWIMNGAGWHLTYFGSKSDIVNKIKSYSHQELNNPEIISELDKNIVDGLYITNEYQTEKIEIDNNANLPLNYRMLL